MARWLENFAISHAKREDLRAECVLATQGPLEGASYGLRVNVAGRLSPEIDLPYAEVAAGRGGMAWCRGLADRVRDLARSAAAYGSPAPA